MHMLAHTPHTVSLCLHAFLVCVSLSLSYAMEAEFFTRATYQILTSKIYSTQILFSLKIPVILVCNQRILKTTKKCPSKHPQHCKNNTGEVGRLNFINLERKFVLGSVCYCFIKSSNNTSHYIVQILNLMHLLTC